MSGCSAAGSDLLAAAGLDRLLRSQGIASEYIEFSGNVAHISNANRLRILNCMGLRPGCAAELDAMLKQREALQQSRLLPPVYLLAPEQTEVRLNLAAFQRNEPLQWQLQHETGRMQNGKLAAADLLAANGSLKFGMLSPGYHTLVLQQGQHHGSTLLIVAPARCWQPPAIAAGKKVWGLSVQLYSVRSERNFGIGDLTDLRAVVKTAAQQGADFVLLNPLHYLDLRYPDNASPYSPSDRRFLNPLYLSLPACEDFAADEVQAAFLQDGHEFRCDALRKAEFVNYAGVAAVKLPLLALMYRQFMRSLQNSQRHHRFRQFCLDGALALADFARMQATLAIRPEPEFADAGFHLYLQWLCAEQLAVCQREAADHGMVLGLVRDLAVGSSSDGCEVQSNPGLFCLDARVGAPPDYYNPLGQNWGLPPLLPEALVQQRFGHFISLLRSNMQHCGALRIDHVMALMRLWWCPNDAGNGEGAYVHYPVDVMFAILRLESVRNRCLVIGEDLGVVPPEIRGYLDPAAIYSNCVFYFERYDGWHFRKPEHYKAQALAMIANHDSPPLRCWWDRLDVPLRRKLGLLVSDDAMRQELEHRQGEKGQVLQWLDEQGLLPASWQDRKVERPLDAVLTAAVVRACGRSASQLVSLQLDDLAAADTPVNVPGTSSEYPNWRRKLAAPLSAVFADAGAQAMLQSLAQERPR
ncbi:MAG TPA: 4-alpha-glucanotransferase [Candidatus Acidoferrum sp.]|nr:4-alpha-glucanotransferase [Candidatus Acidoferrum sp.]